MKLNLNYKLKLNRNGFKTTDKINWQDLQAATEAALQK